MLGRVPGQEGSPQPPDSSWAVPGPCPERVLPRCPRSCCGAGTEPSPRAGDAAARAQGRSGSRDHHLLAGSRASPASIARAQARGQPLLPPAALPTPPLTPQNHPEEVFPPIPPRFQLPPAPLQAALAGSPPAAPIPSLPGAPGAAASLPRRAPLAADLLMHFLAKGEEIKHSVDGELTQADRPESSAHA